MTLDPRPALRPRCSSRPSAAPSSTPPSSTSTTTFFELSSHVLRGGSSAYRGSAALASRQDGGHAAVDGDDGAGDVGRSIRAEERRELGHFFRLAAPLEGGALHELGEP